MTKQELIKKYSDKKLLYKNQTKRNDVDILFKSHHYAQMALVSGMIADLKKLNEAIVSEDCVCKCDKQEIIYTVHPLPDICSYCRMAVQT